MIRRLSQNVSNIKPAHKANSSRPLVVLKLRSTRRAVNSCRVNRLLKNDMTSEWVVSISAWLLSASLSMVDEAISILYINQ